ncbi:MAG TPA: hypothetical protein VHD62_09470 [Opitutaceae bacterium]|nr:hypothetical protein [Opitutaceae bacterium]
MKSLKFFSWVAGVVVALLLIAVALAFMPAVQTWAVRRAIAGQPGTTIEIGRIAAGWSSAEITGVRIARADATITAKSATARYSAWDYLAHRRVNVDTADLHDVVIDLRPAAPSPSATARPPAPISTARPPASATSPADSFRGLLAEAQLPVDLRVAHLAANGRALLAATQTVEFEINGSDIGTALRGTLDWKADFSDRKNDAPVTAAHAQGTAAVRISSERRIDLVDTTATVSARGQNLPSDELRLAAKAEHTAGTDAETYTLAIDLAHAGATAHLVTLAAHFDAAAHEIAGNWKLSIARDQLAAFLAGVGLPDIAADGAGKFTARPATDNLATSGELQATVSRLEKISPVLGAIGDVRLHTTFDGGVDGKLAHLEQLQLEATGANGQKFAQVDTHQRIAFSLENKRVTLADPKAELARITLQNLPLSWAQPFVKPLAIERGDISLVLAVESDADGSQIRARTVEPLLLRNATIRSGDRPLVEQLTISTRPQVDYSAEKISAQLADLKITLPAGDTLTGTVDADVTKSGPHSIVAFATQLQGKILGALKPYLPLDPGPLALSSQTRGRLDGQTLQIDQSSTTIARDGGPLLASLDLPQHVTVDLAKKTFAAANVSAPIALVRLGEVPLAWAQAFVPNSQFTGSLAGATLELTARGLDELTVNTTAPLALRGVGAILHGQPLAQALDATVDFTATKRGETIDYIVRRFEIKQGGASFLTFAATGRARSGAKLDATAKGNLTLDASALSNQPAAAKFATLARGKITATFDATLADTIQLTAQVGASGLVARASNQPLGDLEFKLKADVKTDGTGAIAAPLTLTNSGRRSDLTIDGKLGRTANEFSFNGKLSSAQLVVDDFQALAALAPSAPSTASAPAANAPANSRASNSPAPVAIKPDAQPFWQGVAGHVDVDLKKIQYGRDYVVEGITGGATISAQRLALENLGGKMKDNAFKVTGAVTFTPKQPQPYTLSGSADVGGLDVGAILRAANPTEKPALETILTLTAKAEGHGATLADLAQNVYGAFDVKGGKGTLRALGRKGETIGTVSSIVGLLGQARGSDTTVAVGELGRELDEMAFDTLTMHVERAADLTMKFTNVEFLSPSTRLTATGTVAHQPGAALADLPFQFDVKLAGKEHMAQLLNRVGALSGTQDDKGYYPMAVSFPVNGTLNKVNNGLWKILAQTGVRSVLGGFLK